MNKANKTSHRAYSAEFGKYGGTNVAWSDLPKGIADLKASGITNMDYNAHGHGAVAKMLPNGTYAINDVAASSADKSFSNNRQPNVVLSYDVKNNTNLVTQADVSKIQANPGTYVPLSNPGAFPKIMSFYRQSGDVAPSMNYSDYKNLVGTIRAQKPL